MAYGIPLASPVYRRKIEKRILSDDEIKGESLARGAR